MAEAAAQDKRSGTRRAGADGRLQPRHRCDEAQRHQHDLRRAGHSDHRPRPHGAGRRHPRAVVPSRAERRLCGRDRGLPDQEARRLPHRVGARLPERPDGARPRHDQLLPDDPDLGLVRARDRRPAAGRLRGDGPARHRQAALQGGLPRAARADIGIGFARAIRAAVSGRPGGVYLDLPAKLFAPGHERRGRREVAGQGHRCGAGAAPRARPRSSARSTCSRAPSAR